MKKLFCTTFYFPSELYTRSRENLIHFFHFCFKSFFLLLENTFKIEGLCARSPPYVTSLGILDEVSATVRHFAGDVADLAYFGCVGATLCVTLSKIIESFYSFAHPLPYLALLSSALMTNMHSAAVSGAPKNTSGHVNYHCYILISFIFTMLNST